MNNYALIVTLSFHFIPFSQEESFFVCVWLEDKCGWRRVFSLHSSKELRGEIYRRIYSAEDDV